MAQHIIKTPHNNALLRKISFFLDMTLCQRVIGSQHFKAMECCYLHGPKCSGMLYYSKKNNFEQPVLIFVHDGLWHMITFHETEVMSLASEQATYTD
jgi:hypothetical protein